jgi:carboxyl-terminal processing protease
MRGPFFVVALLIVGGCTAIALDQSPQPEARTYLQQALDILKSHALYPKETNWKTLSEETFSRAATAKTASDTYPAIVYACAQLRKLEQCYLRPPDSSTNEVRQNVADSLIANAPPAREGMSIAPSRFVGRKEPSLSMLQDAKGKSWAFLVVPQCMPPYTDMSKSEPFLAAWSAALRFFIIEGYDAHGWIVDLRGNGGGNTWASMAALGPLLGDGTLGTFVIEGKRQSWFYKNGQLSLQTRDENDNARDSVVRSIGGPHVDLSKIPVAILIDNATAGPGEQIAIAFAGRNKARSFGVPSSGYAGCCARYKLPDGAFINMELGLVEDRRGRTYPEGVKPDQRVDARVGEGSLASDPVIEAAMDWLRSVE